MPSRLIDALRRRFLPWLLGMMILVNAEAHTMKQVRSEITVQKGGWQASVWLEAWTVYPLKGPHNPPGKVGGPNSAGPSWLATLDAADHAMLRDTAKGFLQHAFALSLGGKELPLVCSFPDYTSERPILQPNAEGNVMIKVDLTGKLAAGESGPLELLWWDDEKEMLVVQVILPGHPGKVVRLDPQGDAGELCVISASGEVEPSAGMSIFGWIKQGFVHILPLGLDHICFILGLFLLQPRVRPLLWQTTAFTLAHSITLALAVLEVFTLPSTIVEPLIAISIAYVGFENLWLKELKSWRIGLVFALGLLHGMGFGSVMKELELPVGEIIQPLIGFNLGVELGQMTVLAVAFGATFWLVKKSSFGLFRKIASAMIGVVGLYWTIERVWGG